MNISTLKITALLLSLVVFFSSCTGKDDATETQESMESIQKQNGIPVIIRTIEPEVFSVYRKYPTTLRALSESTAYSLLNDVVREIKFEVGDHVSRDQIVLSFSRDNASFLQAEANFKNAETTYKRSSALFENAGLSKQEFDNVRTQYEVARAAYKSAADMVDVKAPISGYISSIDVRETENVSQGTALFTVTASDGFEARLYATRDEVSDIHVGTRARIQEGASTIEGSVTQVPLIMDSSRQAFPVVVNFPGVVTGLVSGMSSDVALETYRNEEAVVVSRTDLVRINGGWGVFIVQDGQAELQPVETGKENGLEIEVVSGLLPGDAMISEVRDGLSSGDKVLVVPSLSD
ncbi:efflux RND transporter periplasmic adaptor subunit [Sediminispirochaeta bajacaliforniensis]|uniref:efflux RND transporter periplasmic adaptor subunit n=1 Tax=Sediminispirochaeta bajacaliforniensis TaxID=148 RepID=UPI000361EEC8|nr:efflux RND transporter periplasmic adaptor subunit [Sediminispirochaeta bajacaliforniensis]